MSLVFAPGDTVAHARHGLGQVLAQMSDLVVVKFDDGLQQVPADELEPAASLAGAVAEGKAADPLEAVLRAQALAITSVNEQWGVFSRSRVQLLPHQLWVCRQVTASWPVRWLVADDVGLGKTIEAGLILMPLLASGCVRRILVLAPAKLVPQWRSRLKTMFDIRLQEYSSSVDSARNNFWDTASSVVASFHTLRADGRGARTRLIAADPWDLVIVDEAHHLNVDERSGDTLAYSLLREMQDRGRIASLLLFTGTPHRGKDHGFFGLMQLLRPDVFTPEADRETKLAALRHAMIRNNKATVTDLRGERLFQPVTTESRDYGYSDAEDLFYRTLSTFILDGRAYAGTLTGRAQTVRMLVLITLQKLAASSIAAIRSALTRRRGRLQQALGGRARGPSTVFVEADLVEGDEAAAENLDAQLVEDEIARLDELIALAAAVSPESKITSLLRLLEELPPDEQVLFFTEYKVTQALVVNALQERFGLGTATFINGDERLDDSATVTGRRSVSIGRDAAADAFNAGQVRFLISTEAGGEGIDLQERCSTLIHVDMPWNPMRLHQRVGRLSRYGQRKEVRVFLLRNPATVEARIWDLLTAKLALIQDALANAMEEREDIARLVIGIAGEGFFNDLYTEAEGVGRGGEGLRNWFDRKTATLGGRDVIDTARDLFGNVARFDFQSVGRDVPKVDLPALQPFFAATLQRHGRRVSRAEDGSLAFKSPDEWRRTSWSVDDRYEGLVFDRALRGDNAASRVLGVGHQLFDLAVREARDLSGRLALLDGIEAPLLVATVEDAVTGTGNMARRLVFGVSRRSEVLEILPDWELLVRLNEILPRLSSTALQASSAGNATAAGAATDNLLAALSNAMPRSTEIFRRPTARAEMLFIPAIREVFS